MSDVPEHSLSCPTEFIHYITIFFGLNSERGGIYPLLCSQDIIMYLDPPPPDVTKISKTDSKP
jgi:hypothetical protein